MASTITLPNTFAALSGVQPGSKLDDNYTAITGFVNARNPNSGTLASRPAAGNQGAIWWATDTSTLYFDNGTTWLNLSTAAPPEALTGLTLSNSGANLGIAVGAATSDDATIANRIIMSLASAFTKTTAAWVVGTGNGALDTGAIAATTWYHVFVIQRTDTNVVDILFSLSATAPTMPASYTKKRRIGSFRTDGASAILAFTQDGDYFRWAASVLDINAANPGTAAVSATLTVPTGVAVVAHMNAMHQRSDVTRALGLISDLAANDEAPSDTAAPGANFVHESLSNDAIWTQLMIRTNTSAQVRYRLSLSAAATTVFIVTLGWYDRRGRG